MFISSSQKVFLVAIEVSLAKSKHVSEERCIQCIVKIFRVRIRSVLRTR